MRPGLQGLGEGQDLSASRVSWGCDAAVSPFSPCGLSGQSLGSCQHSGQEAPRQDERVQRDTQRLWGDEQGAPGQSHGVLFLPALPWEMHLPVGASVYSSAKRENLPMS